MSRPDRTSAAPPSPAPRFAAGWAALAYAIATLTVAWPALLGRFLVNPHSDQYIAGYAFRDFAAQSLRAGQGIPQWNPYLFGGLPYVAAMHGDIFYPTALLRVILPTDVAMTWGFVIHLFLAGLFTYGFLRAWGLGFFPSLVGGMAYLLGGPIASYASPGHDGKLFVSALLPLGLWLLVRGIRDGRHWAWGAFAITVGLAVLSPHPQLLQYFLLTCGAFALFLALGPDANGVRLDRRTAVRRLAYALGAVVIGMAIGAIQFAPVREYVPYSPRAGGRDYAYATSYSFPLIELFNLYLPQFTGILDRYWGPNGIHLHSEYLGGSVLLLASAAFGGDARRRFRRFWIGVAVVSFLWMLGGSTPFFHLVYALVPGTKFFRAPSTIIYVFAFAVSIFAALGTERLLEGALSRRFLFGWFAAAGVVALLASVGVVGAMAEAGARASGVTLALAQGIDPQYAPQVADQFASRANANAAELILGAWRSFLFVALAVAALLWYARGRVSAAMVGAVLAVIVAVDLWSVERDYWLFSAPARELFASDPAIELLKREPQPGRVVVFAQSDTGIVASDPYFGTDSHGRGTGLMVHRIRSVAGYHGNEIGRYQTLMDMRLSNGAPAMISPTFWRHENTRYLYTNAPVHDSSLKLMTGPVRNSAGSIVYLYRLPGDNPYAWVATAIAKAPDNDAEAAVLDPRFDPARIAVFDTSAKVQANAARTPPEPAAISATTTGFGPGRADITLSGAAPAGSALVVSENYYPGWHATVDGREASTFRADYNLIGVPLPSGARSVSLRYSDPAVSTGRVITFLALLIAIAALGAGLLADRRRTIA
ncbi:MAG TPA: YfhO family protein [Gemmatimonadaceae bacterium]|nr:YfhO family protein [Gemmatimonadaceae bacterium]